MGRPSSRPGPARRVDRRVLGEHEAVAVAPGLLHDEQGEAAMGSERSGSVRASSISTSARAAKVHQVLTPLMSHPPRWGGRGDDAGDVGTEVGLGDRDRRQHLRRGQLGQPLLLLLLGAAVDQGPGEDLGPGDQRAADAERSPAQLLGGDDHAHVVALPTGGEAVVLLGDGQPEAAQFGQAGDDLLGDVAVGAVDVLGVGAHLLLGETVERLADELEVGVQVARALDPRPGPPGRPDRGGGQEVGGRGAPSGLHAPVRFPARHPTDQIGHDVGHEGGGEELLGLTEGAVGEAGAGRGHRGGGVGHVVGDDLIGVHAAVGADGRATGIDQMLRQLDGARPRRPGRGMWTASWPDPTGCVRGAHLGNGAR
jgi:hypothetical protein